jgi:hypothetical protein
MTRLVCATPENQYFQPISGDIMPLELLAPGIHLPAPLLPPLLAGRPVLAW